MSSPKTLDSKNEYTIGWIAALSAERAAATALLDERHDRPLDFQQKENDKNSYTWGRIHDHNIVIASLPDGGYGLTNATKTALGLASSFPHIKIGLLVGIGAGIPESGVDIRLGDVAVSRPEGTTGGVIQYDTGKAKNGQWERVGVLASPPEVLMHALAKLQAEHQLEDSQIPTILSNAQKTSLKFAENFKHPGVQNDRLFGKATDRNEEVELERTPRRDTNPRIHYGTIASGNILVKDAETRRKISTSIGQPFICLEMEAAGLMNGFPCLVIRGICDYADAHKNDIWQHYASATAAAFAKELLLYVPQAEIEKTQSIQKVLEDVQSSINDLNTTLHSTQRHTRDEKMSALLQALYTCPYTERKDRNPKRVAGTCEWFTNHPLYRQFHDDPQAGLLWVSADPGCGKSVLARHLVEEALADPKKIVCYFFFKDDFADQKSSANAACALLRQLLLSDPHNISQRILENFSRDGSKYTESFDSVWQDFVAASAGAQSKEIVCYLDALDECQEKDRRQLISSICQLYSGSTKKSSIKILATSRPYYNINDEFKRWDNKIPIIHLDGDNDEEKDAISKEIDIVIGHRIEEFSVVRDLTLDETIYLLNRFTSTPQRTYLWAHLCLNLLEETPGFTRDDARRLAEDLPSTVDEAYDKILERSANKVKTRLILNLIIAATRPFTLQEMLLFLGLENSQTRSSHLEECLEPEERFKTTVRQLCGLFVVVVDSKLYLLHQTGREFLLSKQSNSNLKDSIAQAESLPYESSRLHWKQTLSLSVAHHRVAERCLWYLAMEGNQKLSVDLYEYCAESWIEHFNSSDIGSDDTAVELASILCKSSSVYFTDWTRAWWRSEPTQYSRVRNLPDFMRNFLCDNLEDESLLISAFFGIPAMVQRELTRSPPRRWRRKTKSKAVWLATLAGCITTVQLLINAGARADVIMDGSRCYGAMPRQPSLSYLQQLYFSRKTRKLNELVQDIDPTDTPLLLAIYASNEAMVQLVLSFGIAWSRSNRHPLQTAACYGNVVIIKLLLDHGLSVEDASRVGVSPLMFYCMSFSHISNGQCQAIHKLLWTKNSLNEFIGGRTLLHYVAIISCEECMRSLICRKPLLNVRDYNETTPLLEAARSGNEMTIDMLIEAGADVRSANNEGMTSLMMATKNWRLSNTHVFEVFLDRGADLNAQDLSGSVFLHHAHSVNALRFGLANGADINARNKAGETPLICYCKDGLYQYDRHGNIISEWLQLGADYTLKDKKGRTAMSYAQELLNRKSAYDSRRIEITLKALREAGAKE